MTYNPKFADYRMRFIPGSYNQTDGVSHAGRDNPKFCYQLNSVEADGVRRTRIYGEFDTEEAAVEAFVAHRARAVQS